MPICVKDARGYLIAMFESPSGITVHLLAEDFDTDIDHRLDEMRFHRSRVNYINKAIPTGVTNTLLLQADTAPTVYLPLTAGRAEVTRTRGGYTVQLPHNTPYAILHFPAK